MRLMTSVEGPCEILKPLSWELRKLSSVGLAMDFEDEVIRNRRKAPCVAIVVIFFLASLLLLCFERIWLDNEESEAALEELQSRIVIAENLPEDHCYQNLMKIFSTVGSVKNIRTCQPQITGNAVPPAARSAKSDGNLFSNKVHAFVEYETVELAEKAVAELNEAGNWRSSLKARLMLKPQTKEPKQGQGRGRKGHDVEVEHEEDEATASEQQQQQPIEKLSEECSGEWDTHVPEQAVIGEEQGNEKAAGQRKGRSRGRGKGRGRGQPHQNQNQNHNHNHNGRGNHHNHNHHHQHQVGTPPSNNQMNSMEQQPKQQPPGPRMPDGTRGFSMGRGKPITVQAD